MLMIRILKNVTNIKFCTFYSILEPLCIRCANNFHTSTTVDKYTDFRMIKDVKKRRVLKEYSRERLCINALRKNTILPKELQVVADEEIKNLPRDSSITRIRGRCVLTSRPRGVLKRWRLSRIMWRHFADYNYLSGVQRAKW